jgi:geranylgeranyl diphosphate synthase type II
MHTLPDYQSLFQDYLTAHTFRQEPTELYEPVNYILRIGGKRLRPLLVLMGCELFSDDMRKALPAAMAVEVFHNFTLLHDDIMDNAPLRRGQPTVHEKYNTNTAILSGDVMLIWAYRFLQDTPSHTEGGHFNIKAQLLDIFNKMAIEVCEGQQMDMNFETRRDVTIPAYLKMIAYKTSVLIASAFQMGALIGGARIDEAAQLYQFGLNLGIAFQIQDDILDSFGDPEKFGKKVGGDIIQNKKTFLVLKAIELAKPSERIELEELMNSPTTDESAKIARVRQLFEQTGAYAEAIKTMDDYLQIGLKHLDDTPLSIERKNYMKTFANDLMQRQK